MQAENIEQMRAAIAVDDGDSHLRHHLGQTGVERLQHLALVRSGIGTGRGHAQSGLKRQPRADHARAVADQDSGMMNIAAVARLDGNSGKRTQARRHQRLVDRAGRHRHRNRQPFRAR